MKSRLAFAKPIYLLLLSGLATTLFLHSIITSRNILNNQICPIPPVTTTDPDYTDYYKAIAQAEEEIVNGKYDKALGTYEALFSKYDFVFAKDAFTACEVAAYVNKRRDFDSLLVRSFKQGVTFALLVHVPLTHNYIAKDSAKYLQLYTVNNNIYLKKIDLALRKEFSQRYCEEQLAMSHSGPGFMNLVNEAIKRIETICQKGHFPGERMIGIDVDVAGCSFYGQLNTGISHEFVFAPLINYPMAYSKLEPYLKAALKQGEVDPFDVAYLYCREQQKQGAVAKDPAKYKAHYNLLPSVESKSDSVNYYRAQIGLCSYETEAKKPEVSKKTGIVFFQ